MKQVDQNQKRKEYMKQAKAAISTGDDGVNFFVKVLASSLLSFYIIRFLPLTPSVDGKEILCSVVTCDCPDHRYRQVFCKHLGIAFLYFLGEDELPIWQLSQMIGKQLRHLDLIEKVRISHLTDRSITIGLLNDACPFPRWRVYTVSDWAKVLPELLVEIEASENHVMSEKEMQSA